MLKTETITFIFTFSSNCPEQNYVHVVSGLFHNTYPFHILIAISFKVLKVSKRKIFPKFAKFDSVTASLI